MALPRISVVTPSFNQAPFLEAALRSVHEQGYPDLEHLVLDGGSTDGSAELIRRFEPRLAYWRSAPDGGQAAALREGFARATGEVLCWINSDDLLLPGALRTVGEAFAAHPDVDLLHGGLRVIDARGRRLFTTWAVLDLEILAYECPLTPQQSMFWRRGLYQRAGGIDPDYRLAMDFDLMIRMLLAGARPLKLSRALGAFRLHPGAKSSTQAAVGAREVARTLERHRLATGTPRARLWKKYLHRVRRFAKDPRTLAAAVLSRLRGAGPATLGAYPSAGA